MFECVQRAYKPPLEGQARRRICESHLLSTRSAVDRQNQESVMPQASTKNKLLSSFFLARISSWYKHVHKQCVFVPTTAGGVGASASSVKLMIVERVVQQTSCHLHVTRARLKKARCLTSVKGLLLDLSRTCGNSEL